MSNKDKFIKNKKKKLLARHSQVICIINLVCWVNKCFFWLFSKLLQIKNSFCVIELLITNHSMQIFKRKQNYFYSRHLNINPTAIFGPNKKPTVFWFQNCFQIAFLKQRFLACSKFSSNTEVLFRRTEKRIIQTQ